MISLIGCVLPRLIGQARALRAVPVATPRNLARLPHHATATLDLPPEEVTDRIRQRLGGWRRAETVQEGTRALSAERGYLREFGNLLFHLSIVGLLMAFAVGKLVGYSGQIIVLANGGQSATPASWAMTRSTPACA